MRRVRRIALYVCTACLHAGLVLGQVTTATLRGRVLDPQGAPVPAASVTVTREDAAISRKATTGADGTFVIANIPPTTVDVVVSATGFSDARHHGVVLEVGGTNVLDIELTVGAVQETVVVNSPRCHGRHHAIGRRRRHSVERDRGTPTQRPEFPRVGTARAGQRPSAQLRSDQEQQRADLVCGPARSRRQHHDRRRGQQRRRGRRAAAERHAGVRAGVPDRHEQVHRGVRTLGVVSDQRGDQVGHGSAPGIGVVFRPRQRLAGRAGDLRRSTGDAPPFDREQVAGSAGGPLASRTFWFGAMEYRNQDGAVLVGVRDVPTRTIGGTSPSLRSTTSWDRAVWTGVPATGRADDSLRGGAGDRHRGQHADRSIGSASQRQRSRNTYNSIVGTWSKVVGPTFVNAATVSFSDFDNAIVPVAAGPVSVDLPQHPDGVVASTFPAPHTETVPDRRHRQPGPRLAQHPRWRRMAEGQRAVRPGRLPGRTHRARRGFRQLRPQRRRACGRWGPAVRGDAAQREAGSGAGAAGCQQQLHRAVSAGRLAAAFGSDVERGPSLRTGHGRQEREPCGRDQSDRAAVPPRYPPCRPQQLGTAHRLQLGAW